MEHREGSKKQVRGKHLNKKDRITIEVMLKNRHTIKEIAAQLGRHRRTIEREIERGTVMHLDTELRAKPVYNSDRGQDVYDLNATAKGPQLKLGKNYKLVAFVRDQILHKRYSPDVVVAKMKEGQLEGAVCTKTLYNYIAQGLIDGVTNATLWEKRKRKKRKIRKVCRSKKHHKRRKSIEKRPAIVDTRKTFGHWEIDLIVSAIGSSKEALLTLVERKTRMIIVRKIPDKSQESVLRAMRSIEASMGSKVFRAIFKSITADNGSEFLDVENMEKSAFSKKLRVTLYYAHPYSSYERGSNENGNRMIRRFIAKGSNIADFTRSYITWVQNWINHYSRKILNYKSAMELFCLEAVQCVGFIPCGI